MNNIINNILNFVIESDYVANKVDIEEELLNFSLQIIELLQFQLHRDLDYGTKMNLYTLLPRHLARKILKALNINGYKSTSRFRK
jgi:hypothetical protein